MNACQILSTSGWLYILNAETKAGREVKLLRALLASQGGEQLALARLGWPSAGAACLDPQSTPLGAGPHGGAGRQGGTWAAEEPAGRSQGVGGALGGRWTWG